MKYKTIFCIGSASLLAAMACSAGPKVDFASYGLALDQATVKVVAGNFFSCALLASGNAACWGENRDGQLGDGTTIDREAPVRVAGPGGFVDIVALNNAVCAVHVSGEVTCWGGGSVSPAITGAVAIEANQTEACVITADQQLVCWGSDPILVGAGADEYYQHNTPVAVAGLTAVTDVALSDEYACALEDTGEVLCWGDDPDLPFTATPSPIATVGQVVDIVGGSHHTCMATTSGEVYCFGEGVRGQLGDGGHGWEHRSTQLVQARGITDAVAVVANFDSTCAVTAGGALYCWGGNDVGQLGDGYVWTEPVGDPDSGELREELLPTKAIMPTGAVSNATLGGQRGCAVLTDGTLECWGYLSPIDDTQGL